MDANTIRFRFIYNRKNKLNRDGEALLQLMAYVPKARKRKFISTELYLNPSQWNKKSSLIINHPLAAQLNWKITELKASYEKKVIDLMRKYDKCSLDDLSKEYKSSYLSFLEFYEQEIEIAKKTRAAGTIKTYWSALHKLKEYRSTIFFSDLNYNFLQGFDGYLSGQDLRQTVIAKYHKIVKRMISQARKKDLIDGNPYDRFTIKSGETRPRVYLTQAEIAKLEELTFDPEELYLERIRDGFLFSCYTSLRDETNRSLTEKMFYKDETGYHMSFTANKTDKSNTFPLAKLFPVPGVAHSKPEALLYKNIELNRKLYGPKAHNHPLFGSMTNQDRNRNSKL